MMTMPYGFSCSGVLGGVIGVIFVVMVNARSIIIQTRVAEKQEKIVRSMSELAYIVLGPSHKTIMELSLFVMLLGLHIAYLMFSGSQIDQIV